MKPLHTPTAAEFKQKRELSGLSQSGLAEFLDLHPNSIKSFESVRTHCSPLIWYAMEARLLERDQEIAHKILEH